MPELFFVASIRAFKRALTFGRAQEIGGLVCSRVACELPVAVVMIVVAAWHLIQGAVRSTRRRNIRLQVKSEHCCPESRNPAPTMMQLLALTAALAVFTKRDGASALTVSSVICRRRAKKRSESLRSYSVMAYSIASSKVHHKLFAKVEM
jgi:hypothetical protein